MINDKSLLARIETLELDLSHAKAQLRAQKSLFDQLRTTAEEAMVASLNLAKAHAEAEAEIEALRNLLRRCEWTAGQCGACQGKIDTGHNQGCLLPIALGGEEHSSWCCAKGPCENMRRDLRQRVVRAMKTLEKS